MRHSAITAFAICIAVTPVAAQDDPADGTRDMEEGFSLLEEGTRLLLRGLMSEMEPALRNLQGALRNLDAYHPPEVLPNGDIIIRRKEPLDVAPDSEIGEGGDVEL